MSTKNLITSVHSSREGTHIELELFREAESLGTLLVNPDDACDYVCRILGAKDATELRGVAGFDGSRWSRIGSGDVWLMSFGDKKICVIKALREFFPGMGLKDAKETVERAPVCIESGLGADEADRLAGFLRQAGATVEIRA